MIQIKTTTKRQLQILDKNTHSIISHIRTYYPENKHREKICIYQKLTIISVTFITAGELQKEKILNHVIGDEKFIKYSGRSYNPEYLANNYTRLIQAKDSNHVLCHTSCHMNHALKPCSIDNTIVQISLKRIYAARMHP